ncbi:hypothetical protein [Paenibacillus sp. IHBB 3054]|uniref:hypothetical protein n=1 Tax=Paenibacillus sp. IHBB 3054 TaxID=3425689 RepID=UPI003F668358
MLNILPVKSTPYPTLRSCIDDCIQSVAEWQGKDSKYMYGNAWQFSFKQQQSSEQSIIDRVSTPRISKEYLAAYHGINFTYVNREEPAMDKSFLLDMLEKRLAGGMPVLVGFDSYSCPWCLAYRKLHTSHACLAVGVDRSSRKIYLTDGYYGRPLESVDLDEWESACHFFAEFSLCEPSRPLGQWRLALEHTLLNQEHEVQPLQVAEHLRAYADAYLETGIIAENPEEYSAYFLLAANTLPITRIRYSLFLSAISADQEVPELTRIAEGYRIAGEMWNMVNQFMIKVMCSGNKPAQRGKIHKKMLEIIHSEEELLLELVQLVSKPVFKS